MSRVSEWVEMREKGPVAVQNVRGGGDDEADQPRTASESIVITAVFKMGTGVTSSRSFRNQGTKKKPPTCNSGMEAFLYKEFGGDLLSHT